MSATIVARSPLLRSNEDANGVLRQYFRVFIGILRTECPTAVARRRDSCPIYLAAYLTIYLPI